MDDSERWGEIVRWAYDERRVKGWWEYNRKSGGWVKNECGCGIWGYGLKTGNFGNNIEYSDGENEANSENVMVVKMSLAFRVVGGGAKVEKSYDFLLEERGVEMENGVTLRNAIQA